MPRVKLWVWRRVHPRGRIACNNHVSNGSSQAVPRPFVSMHRTNRSMMTCAFKACNCGRGAHFDRAWGGEFCAGGKRVHGMIFRRLGKAGRTWLEARMLHARRIGARYVVTNHSVCTCARNVATPASACMCEHYWVSAQLRSASRDGVPLLPAWGCCALFAASDLAADDSGSFTCAADNRAGVVAGDGTGVQPSTMGDMMLSTASTGFSSASSAVSVYSGASLLGTLGTSAAATLAASVSMRPPDASATCARRCKCVTKSCDSDGCGVSYR